MGQSSKKTIRKLRVHRDKLQQSVVELEEQLRLEQNRGYEILKTLRQNDILKAVCLIQNETPVLSDAENKLNMVLSELTVSYSMNALMHGMVDEILNALIRRDYLRATALVHEFRAEYERLDGIIFKWSHRRRLEEQENGHDNHGSGQRSKATGS
jgi:hypothetical protein